jgi:general secretion pathway protein D
MIACSRGAFALVCRISRFRILLIPFALGLSACQTIDDAPTSSAWNYVPSTRTNEFQSRYDRTSSAPLLANTRGGQSTVIEGSGRFVGEPPTGASAGHLKMSPTVSRLTSSTCRRRRRPRPSSAIFSRSNTPSILALRARSRSKRPSLVSRSVVIDLFQAALRSNNAALVNSKGLYRIVPADQAVIGAGIRTDDTRDAGEQIGSGLQVVQLKYVAASEIRRVLETIAPRGGIVRTDDSRHLITLSGNDREGPMAGLANA